MIFHFTNNFDLHNCSRDRIELVRGDSPYVVARVHGQRVIGSACFGLYDQGDFGGSALANVTQFVTVPGDDYVDYIGILALNTDALTALVGAKDTVEVAGEWEIKYADDSGNIITVTPEKVEVLVSNDYIRQSPPSQVDPADAYATEKFVEEVLKERVAVETEAALGGIRDDAEAAATRAEEARDTTKLAESAAGVSSESARLHALSAQDSASRASGSASSAKRSELVCEDYAKLSRESATNAASSSVAAKNAAGDAQTAAKKAEDVAGSLGSEVAEAKQSAVEAKASATSAATSAATAKTEVGKIGNSVTTAQFAATQAAGHASTASTKATQAATSATNAGNSETKAKASETAAGTSATNAANSATTASGHASTASAKATQAGTSATAASASATQAAGSVTAAAGHASTATTKATEAAGRATAAADYAVLAGTARDAAVTAKTAAEAAADRAEAASGGGVTDAQVNAKINTHNTSAAAHSGEFSKKLDNPTGGTTGQVLTKTASGTAWNNLDNGTPSSPTTYAYVDVTGILEVTGLFTPKGGVRTELTSPVSTAGGGNFGTNAALLDKDSPTKTPLLSLSLQKFGSETTPIPRLQVLYRPLEIVIPSDEANNKPLLSNGLLMMGYTEKFLTPLGEPGSHTHHVRWLDNPYHLVNVGMLRAMLDDHLQSIKSYVTDAVLAAAPVGSIWPHWSNVIPDGFLLCNKGLVSKTTYARLYASRPTIGPGWGESGDKFYLPDLGARYPRGTNNGNVGVYLEDAIRNISGGIGLYGHSYAGLYSERVWGALEARSAGAEGAVRPVLNSTSGETSSGVTVEMILSANKQVPTAEENRPRTTVVNFIIKY